MDKIKPNVSIVVEAHNNKAVITIRLNIISKQFMQLGPMGIVFEMKSNTIKIFDHTDFLRNLLLANVFQMNRSVTKKETSPRVFHFKFSF